MFGSKRITLPGGIWNLGKPFDARACAGNLCSCVAGRCIQCNVFLRENHFIRRIKPSRNVYNMERVHNELLHSLDWKGGEQRRAMIHSINRLPHQGIYIYMYLPVSFAMAVTCMLYGFAIWVMPSADNIHRLYLPSPDGWAVWGVVMSTRWWLLVDHCVLRNWDRILVRAVKGLISSLLPTYGMVLICPLLWQRDVKTPTNIDSTLSICGIINLLISRITYATFPKLTNNLTMPSQFPTYQW